MSKRSATGAVKTRSAAAAGTAGLSKYFTAASAAAVPADATADAMQDDRIERDGRISERESESDEEEEDAAVVAAARPAKLRKSAVSEDVAVVASAASAAATKSPASAAAASTVARADPTVLSFPDELLGGPVSAYSAAFDRIARSLLLDMDLMANGHRLKLREVEMYWHATPSASNAAAHTDLFAHAHPVQLNNFANWYWHRQGQKPDASYKGGNYKGLDVTMGSVSGGGHGGILIRSVEKADGSVIEGSCLVADELLRLHGKETIVELVATWKGNTSAFAGPTLFFTPKLKRAAVKPGTPLIIKSPRVGLTLKQSGETRPHFIMLPYRYSLLPFFNKKQKQLIVASAYEELGAAKTRELCGCTQAYLDKIVATYESGKKLASMDKFTKNNKAELKTDDLIQMFGAWMVTYGAKPHVAVLRA